MTKELKELNSSYLSPHTVRMPSGYFAFFKDEEQSELVARPANEAFEVARINLVKPDYLRLNDKIMSRYYSVGERVARVLRFVLGKNYENNNPAMLHSKVKKLMSHLKKEVNRELYRTVKKKKFDRGVENYILYPLHKQPEASVDVIGRYYDDQYTNILNIWRALPDNWLLLVKEHSNAIGDRSIFFYRKINKLNNLLLICEHEDSHVLINNAKAVVTVSGTAAYEAALSGVISFTFAKSFFNELDLCHRLSLDQLRSSSLDKIIEKLAAPSIPKKTVAEYEEWLSARMFKGIISDPDSNPGCMAAENLINVAHALKSVINASS
jgi:hypothetical protein